MSASFNVFTNLYGSVVGALEEIASPSKTAEWNMETITSANGLKLTITVQFVIAFTAIKQVIRVKKTRGAAAPRTRITWAYLLDSEEPSLKLLRSVKLRRTNSSPISYSLRLKLAIFLSTI